MKGLTNVSATQSLWRLVAQVCVGSDADTAGLLMSQARRGVGGRNLALAGWSGCGHSRNYWRYLVYPLPALVRRLRRRAQLIYRRWKR